MRTFLTIVSGCCVGNAIAEVFLGNYKVAAIVAIIGAVSAQINVWVTMYENYK